jgi:hypothetical protein
MVVWPTREYRAGANLIILVETETNEESVDGKILTVTGHPSGSLNDGNV